MNRGLSVALLSALLLSGCFDGEQAKAPAQMPPLPVKAFEVSYGETTTAKSYPAVLKPYQEIDLIARVSGYLTKRSFKEGSKVKQGELLYEIEQSEYLAALNVAKARVATLQSNYDKAEVDFNRATTLYKKEAISTEQMDNARFAYDAAKATLAEAKASLQSAQLSYDYTTIKAPIGGLIGLTSNYEGAYIEKGTKLATITMQDPIYAEFSLPKADIARVLPQIKDGSAKKELIVDGKKYDAVVDYISPTVDAKTDTLLFRLKVQNSSGELIVGNFAKVEVSNIAVGHVSVVPENAVIKTAQASIVFVVGADGIINPRPVEVGEIVSGGIVIKSGIKEGEKIVRSNMAKLRPATKVQIIADESQK